MSECVENDDRQIKSNKNRNSRDKCEQKNYCKNVYFIKHVLILMMCSEK